MWKKVEAQAIIDIIKSGNSLGSMTQDAKNLGFEGAQPHKPYSQRLRALIDKGHLSLDEVTSTYPRFDLPQKERATFETDLDIAFFVRFGRPSGSVAKDAPLFQYKNRRSYNDSLQRLIDNRLLRVSDLERAYPKTTWKKPVLSDKILKMCVEEGMLEDDIAIEFGVEPEVVQRRKKELGLDDYRQIEEREFQLVFRAAADFEEATIYLDLDDQPIQRRAYRSLDQGQVNILQDLAA